MTLLRALLADRRGASAAEFVLILPLALVFLFGIIDAGRYAWQLNQLEKAAQSGVRYAVVTDIVPQGLNAYDTVGLTCADGTVLDVSDRICPEALGTITCSGAGGVSCSCSTGPCPSLGTTDTAAFNRIVSRISRHAPMVGPENVALIYSGSGIGFAGDPATSDDDSPLSDIAPLVTVQISGVDLRAMTLFGGGLEMPPVSSSLTLEDGDGAIGY
ncbi:pilus assembly protein [Aurantiacibacter sp. MUD11]|uniref:TadE/TadG family type IV pilus assembly protein n=1 Tax=Aurantiacibacter sp. MUD11 TaxID=3003265 RepID=UPI0022AB4A8D|nr:TadE/TadG family type IV pilus assembly protein [Aurantiacibacter sp. MUD11]WAT16709.1 pilus assembly protein [Aurantiacibacter sp. MUD11]